jgi:gliding motility-associated-like protein
MPRSLALFWCLILVGPHFVSAQKEEAIWYLGSGQALNFVSDPPKVLPTGGVSTTDDTGNGFANVADSAGNMLFFTDAHNVMWWKAPGTIEIVNRGEDLYGNGDRLVIIKKPGARWQYYLFYLGDGQRLNNEILYCIVNIDPATKRASVVDRNLLLYEGLHGAFTITAGCGGKEFWLVGDADVNATEGTDKMFAYKINETGISEKVVSAPISMTQSGAYRFSPDGTKLFFNFSGPTSSGSAIADFDHTTGIVSNVKVIGPCCGFGEFSSNATKLYVNYPDADKIINIKQYDLTSATLTSATIQTPAMAGTKMQIARDGNIFIILTKNSFPQLGIINNPNLGPAECDFQALDVFPPITLGLTLPEFSTNAFYRSPFSTANAGDDKEVCMADKITIGAPNPSNQKYQWVPETHLANPLTDQTDFVFNRSVSSTLELQYVLKGLGDECVKADTMTVFVRPRPAPVISGSPSVCPGVTGVEYSVTSDPGYVYNWTVDGGVIASGLNTNLIKVDWADTNPAAKVSLIVNNEFDCIAEPVNMPVKINVELDTQTPVGITDVCENLLLGNSYHIQNTNGSVYTWNILAGKIQSGQGSNEINADWLHDGSHEIWVTEKSTTRDTVCFGSSDTLTITVYRDSLQLFIHSVSVDPQNDLQAVLLGGIKNLPINFSTPVAVLRRKEEESEWVQVEAFDIKKESALQFDDTGLETDSAYYEYKLQTVNGCHLEVTSVVHNTIQMQANASEQAGKITLKWNPYSGWTDQDVSYEIWRKVDAEASFTLVGRTDQQTFELNDAGKGFHHALIVKAVSETPDHYSWSNNLEVNFEHALFLPNVFTPNHDQINDTFAFNHLELYPENELMIYDRYGNDVYRTRDYHGDWTGEGLTPGVYYYRFKVFSTGKEYKGWVQIIR